MVQKGGENGRRRFLWELLQGSSVCLTGFACRRDRAENKQGGRLDRASGWPNINDRSEKFSSIPSRVVDPPGGLNDHSANSEESLPDGLRTEHFHLYTRTPLTLESKRDALGIGSITPTSRLFVRNNLPLPDSSIVERADEWQLQVDAGTKSWNLTLRELKQIGMDTIASVLQCSGNGRRFFPHGPSGSPWGVGAAGCVLWTGVPLRMVIEALGASTDGKKYLTATGGEVLPALPPTMNPDDIRVERSIPIAKAWRDCLLAWNLNGLPLPLSHGGPLRLVVPGYYGINFVKYVRQLRFTSEESSAKIMRKGYRWRSVGEKGGPDQPTMKRMAVKSWIQGPGAEGEKILAGTVQFHGVAFSGERGVDKVEVSVDEGVHFRPAQFIGPDLGPNAWRVFVFSAELKPGKVRIAARATDRSGEVQPRERVENERGYGNNSWYDLALEVEVVESLQGAPAKSVQAITSAQSFPTGKEQNSNLDFSEIAQTGRRIFRQVDPPCTACHTLADAKSNMRIGPNLNDKKPDANRIRMAIQHGSGTMPAYAGNLNAEEIEALVRYVEEATRR